MYLYTSSTNVLGKVLTDNKSVQDHTLSQNGDKNARDLILSENQKQQVKLKKKTSYRRVYSRTFFHRTVGSSYVRYVT